MVWEKGIGCAVAIGMGIVLGLAGCQPHGSDGATGPGWVFQTASGDDVQSAPYRVDPPDEITIHAPRIKEIDGLKQEVRSDGVISLNLLGNMKVSGLTVDQVTDELKEKASVFYANADVRVEVKAKSKFYYVFGRAVNVQGKKPFTGHDTVIAALAEAGFNENAWPQQVRISRPGSRAHSKSEVAVVDFTKIFEYGIIDQNYVVKEGDIIYVPDSPLKVVNKVTSDIFAPITGGAGAASAVHP